MDVWGCMLGDGSTNILLTGAWPAAAALAGVLPLLPLTLAVVDVVDVAVVAGDAFDGHGTAKL